MNQQKESQETQQAKKEGETKETSSLKKSHSFIPINFKKTKDAETFFSQSFTTAPKEIKKTDIKLYREKNSFGKSPEFPSISPLSSPEPKDSPELTVGSLDEKSALKEKEKKVLKQLNHKEWFKERSFLRPRGKSVSGEQLNPQQSLSTPEPKVGSLEENGLEEEGKKNSLGQ